jgi:hypothetical protein
LSIVTSSPLQGGNNDKTLGRAGCWWRILQWFLWRCEIPYGCLLEVKQIVLLKELCGVKSLFANATKGWVFARIWLKFHSVRKGGWEFLFKMNI